MAANEGFPSGKARQREEERLRGRVRTAIARLDATRSERSKLFAEGADLGISSDGCLALRRGLRLHREAVHELGEATRALRDLLASGDSKAE